MFSYLQSGCPTNVCHCRLPGRSNVLNQAQGWPHQGRRWFRGIPGRHNLIKLSDHGPHFLQSSRAISGLPGRQECALSTLFMKFYRRRYKISKNSRVSIKQIFPTDITPAMSFFTTLSLSASHTYSATVVNFICKCKIHHRFLTLERKYIPEVNS